MLWVDSWCVVCSFLLSKRAIPKFSMIFWSLDMAWVSLLVQFIGFFHHFIVHINKPHDFRYVMDFSATNTVLYRSILLLISPSNVQMFLCADVKEGSWEESSHWGTLGNVNRCWRNVMWKKIQRVREIREWPLLMRNTGLNWCWRSQAEIALSDPKLISRGDIRPPNLQSSSESTKPLHQAWISKTDHQRRNLAPSEKIRRQMIG